MSEIIIFNRTLNKLLKQVNTDTRMTLEAAIAQVNHIVSNSGISNYIDCVSLNNVLRSNKPYERYPEGGYMTGKIATLYDEINQEYHCHRHQQLVSTLSKQLSIILPEIAETYVRDSPDFKTFSQPSEIFNLLKELLPPTDEYDHMSPDILHAHIQEANDSFEPFFADFKNLKHLGTLCLISFGARLAKRIIICFSNNAFSVPDLMCVLFCLLPLPKFFPSTDAYLESKRAIQHGLKDYTLTLDDPSANTSLQLCLKLSFSLHVIQSSYSFHKLVAPIPLYRNDPFPMTTTPRRPVQNPITDETPQFKSIFTDLGYTSRTHSRSE